MSDLRASRGSFSVKSRSGTKRCQKTLKRKKGIVLKKKKKKKKNPYWRIHIEMFIFTTDYKIERDTVLEIKADKIEGKILENNL